MRHVAPWLAERVSDPSQIHDDQLAIDALLVSRLILGQFPEWDGLPVTRLSSDGTVNAIYRLGDELTVRLPLLPGDPAHVRAELELEARASRAFAQISPVSSPEPVAIGAPGEGYPLPWSVQTFLPGTDAGADVAAQASTAFADDLARLVGALREADPDHVEPREVWRGGDLGAKDAWVQESLDKSVHLVDVPRLRKLWSELRELPRAGADVPAHGDLIPGNILLRGDRLAGVLDTGGCGVTDRGLDLLAGWHLLEDGPRERFLRTLDVTDLEWRRATAWALEQSIGAAWYYEHTNKPMFTMGMRTLRRILAAE